MGKIMRRVLLCFLIWPFVSAQSAFAEIEITRLDVVAVVQNQIVVQYEWSLEVTSSESEVRQCELRIVFTNENGEELLTRRLPVEISPGANPMEGKGIADPDVWSRMKAYKARITCP